jgi:hypothetical protein
MKLPHHRAKCRVCGRLSTDHPGRLGAIKGVCLGFRGADVLYGRDGAVIEPRGAEAIDRALKATASAASALLEELKRLRGIIDAVTSSELDEYRAGALTAQDRLFGSREALLEKLGVARDALEHYAQGADSDRARNALIFTEGYESEEREP